MSWVSGQVIPAKEKMVVVFNCRRPKLTDYARALPCLWVSLVSALLLGLLVLPAALIAEDVVYLKPTTNNRVATRVMGTITEFTGRELLIRTASGRESMIPASRVEQVIAEYSKTHNEADLLFAQGKYAEAVPVYKRAATDESRAWVRRQQLAQIAWCLRYENDHQQAAQAFLLILNSDPTTQYFDVIPLSWRRLTLTLAMERQAQTWLREADNPAAQLIGASWLLTSTAANREAARATLGNLTRAADKRIGLLAEAQLWRTQLVTAREAEIPRWQATIAALPDTLRAGPYHLLGQLQARHNRHENAALTMMRVPILFPRERALAAESLLAAATSMEQAGLHDEARTNLIELVEKFPASEAAAVARTKISATPTGG